MVWKYLERLDDILYRRITDKKRELEKEGKLTKENLDKIKKMIETEFIYNTNSMEGNTLTYGQTQLVLEGMTVSDKPLSDIQEIKNNPKAIEFIKNLAFNNNYKITQQDILKLHEISTRGVLNDAGKYREDDNITVTGSKFTPTFWYEIPNEMEDLVEFINENPDGLSPIELAAHIHFFFVRIHPFHDGNGRIARLLTNFIFLRNNYPFIIFKKVEKKQYLDNLKKADIGEFTPFLVYIAGLVEQMFDIFLLQFNPKQKLLSLSDLAKNTPYSAKYLGLLASKRRIDAIKEGKTWKTTRKVIDTYMNQHSKKTITKSI